MERSRLLVTDAAELPLRQATGSLIITLGRKNMKYIWHVASALSASVAGIQILAVSDRISHFTTIAWKTGIETSGVIDAGRTMLFIFFGASAAFLCLSLISEEKLRSQKSNLLYVSKFAGLSLVAGMVIWGGMVASPYVIISNR